MTKKKGSLFLELNFLLLVLAMLFSGFSQGMITIWQNIDSVNDHIYLGRVSRDLLAILEYQLTLHTTTAKIQKVGDRCIIHCYGLGGARRKSFFCKKYPKTNDYGFYQETQSMGNEPGTNPLSPPDIGVTGFQVIPLSTKMVRVNFTLTILATGRHKAYTGILYLRNGVIL